MDIRYQNDLGGRGGRGREPGNVRQRNIKKIKFKLIQHEKRSKTGFCKTVKRCNRTL